VTAEPRELSALRDRLAEIEGVRGALRLLAWDKSTHMPPGGAEARGESMAVLERISHERLIDPEIGRLLDALEPWAQEQEPDSDVVCMLKVARRDHVRAVQVPSDLAAEMARAGAVGEQAWLQAYMAADFSLFRDALARHVELTRQYAACFPDAEHPYDTALDVYEPGLTYEEIRPLFDGLVPRLVPLIRAATDAPHMFEGTFPVGAQRELVDAVLGGMGFDPRTWRIDDSQHPFCQSPGPGDFRITTRFAPDGLSFALYSGLHEFGHGLYDEGVDPRQAGTPLYSHTSLGIHESQSRLWENIVGRGLPFLTWLLPHLREHLDGFDAIDPPELFRRANGVRPSLVRVEADETTYNLHIAIRMELEVALLEGRLEADGVPDAWAEQVHRLLGLEVPDDTHGALQDIHWSLGAIGYFPTYTLGNLMAAQLWERIQASLPEVEADIEAGRFSPLREWLREHVHKDGRKYAPRELLHRATGQALSPEPFLAYLEAKLSTAGVLASRPATS
jgi:carboxypeptidase Taq